MAHSVRYTVHHAVGLRHLSILYSSLIVLQINGFAARPVLQCSAAVLCEQVTELSAATIAAASRYPSPRPAASRCVQTYTAA